jgi:hypothetical protein
MDRSFVDQNARSLEHLRSLVARVSDRDLATMVNEYWNVAGVLGHMAFWDGRALFMAGKLARDEPFTPSDEEPEDVDWINDSTRPLVHAVPQRAMAELALNIAEETDSAMAALPHAIIDRIDEHSPLNPVRARHREEHLQEIEAALRDTR